MSASPQGFDSNAVAHNIVVPLKRKNGLESPFVVEMRGFVAEGVIEERVSSLTKAKRQPWLGRGSATQLRTTGLCKSPQK
jgi:hypothetical protein